MVRRKIKCENRMTATLGSTVFGRIRHYNAEKKRILAFDKVNECLKCIPRLPPGLSSATEPGASAQFGGGAATALGGRFLE
jgi:hypothetical protein